MAGKRTGSGAASGNKTTPAAASRIQSTQTKAGNDSGKGSFPARVQSAAARNTNAGAGAGAAAKSTGGAKGKTGL